MTANVSTRLCHNCMSAHPRDVAVCPYCGYDSAAYKPHPLFLKPGLLLQEQYVLGRVLGQGGFGITYVGLDKHLCKRVAIKEYLPSNLATRSPDGPRIVPLEHQEQAFSQSLGLFINEARYLAKFEHPNIVRVLNYFEANHTGYMVMEYLDGTPALAWLRAQGGHLAPAAAMEIVRPLLDALHTIHAENIYHLDISAQNIFIRDDASPVLFDFGAARRVIGDYTHTLALVLKRGYSPLEQYADGGRIGPWTDIYACAAFLYLLLGGRLPPPAPERFHVETLVAPHRFSQLKIAPAFSEAVCKGLAVKAEDRFSDVRSFQAALEQALLASPDASSRSSPRRWALAGLLAVASLAFFYYTALRNTEPPAPVAEASPAQPEMAAPRALPEQPSPVAEEQAQENLTHVLLARAGAFLDAGEAAKAHDAFTTLAELEPEHPALAEAFIQVAAWYRAQIQEALTTRQWQKAGALLRQAEARFPQDAELARLAQRLQAELKAQRLSDLFARADVQLAALKLTTPSGDNAYETYREILRLAPGHKAALAGENRIAGEYARLAQQQEDVEKKKFFVAKGLSIAPQHPELLHLESALHTPPPPLAPEPPSAARPEPTPALAELTEQAGAAHARADWERAAGLYKSILILYPEHTQAREGLQQIAAAYLQRARESVRREQLPEALWQVSKGLNTVPEHPALLALQAELKQRLEQQTAAPAPIVPPAQPTPPVKKEERNGSTLPITPSF